MTTTATVRPADEVQESDRLASLRRFGRSGNGAAPDFDEVVRLATTLTSRPFAVLALVDRDGDFTVVAATSGRSGVHRDRNGLPWYLVVGTEQAVCHEDLCHSLSDQALGALSTSVRSFVGVPLRLPDGVVVGALCVADEIARPGEPATVSALESLANLLVTSLAARAALADMAVQAERLSQDARTDPLTGLLNRRSLQPLLHDLAEGSCAALVDLDHFKVLNDTHGHAAGDQALRTLASVLRSCSRERDLVARWGGEEFVVLFPLSTPDEALAAMERIRITWSQVGLTTLSAGIAWRGVNESGEDVLARADVALYAAKAAGRDRVLVYEPGMASRETPPPSH